MILVGAGAHATGRTVFSLSGAAVGAIALAWFPGGKIIGAIGGGLFGSRLFDEIDWLGSSGNSPEAIFWSEHGK